jgi:hypothetical protein
MAQYVNDGALYDPVADAWSPPIATARAPAPRLFFTQVWDGASLFVWGGVNALFRPIASGAIYGVRANRWTPVNPNGAPSARLDASGVWTGSVYVVWGGSDAQGEPLGDGATYDPRTRTWTPMTLVGAPPARSNHTAVWDGARMIVWGGSGPCCNQWFDDGYAYTP